MHRYRAIAKIDRRERSGHGAMCPCEVKEVVSAFATVCARSPWGVARSWRLGAPGLGLVPGDCSLETLHIF